MNRAGKGLVIYFIYLPPEAMSFLASSGFIPRTLTRYSILYMTRLIINNKSYATKKGLLTSYHTPIFVSPLRIPSGRPPTSPHAPWEKSS